MNVMSIVFSSKRSVKYSCLCSANQSGYEQLNLENDSSVNNGTELRFKSVGKVKVKTQP